MSEKWIKSIRVIETIGPETWVRDILSKSLGEGTQKARYVGTSVIREVERREEEIDPPGPYGTFVLCDKCKIGFVNRKYCVGTYGTARCCLGEGQPCIPHYDIWCPVCDFKKKETI